MSSEQREPRLIARSVWRDGLLWDLVYEYPDGSIEGRRRVRGSDAEATTSDVARGRSPEDVVPGD